MFYIANWKTNDTELNDSKCYLYLILLLISSWMEFWYVIIIPKYLDFATIWKYFLALFILLFYPAFWRQDINIIIAEDVWKLVPSGILFEYFMGYSFLDTFFHSAGGILVTFKYSTSHKLSCCTDFMDLLWLHAWRATEISVTMGRIQISFMTVIASNVMEPVYTHAIWRFGKANIQVGLLYPKAHLHSKWKIRLFGYLREICSFGWPADFPFNSN
jgi:hypothetical protein